MKSELAYMFFSLGGLYVTFLLVPFISFIIWFFL